MSMTDKDGRYIKMPKSYETPKTELPSPTPKASIDPKENSMYGKAYTITEDSTPVIDVENIQNTTSVPYPYLVKTQPIADEGKEEEDNHTYSHNYVVRLINQLAEQDKGIVNRLGEIISLRKQLTESKEWSSRLAKQLNTVFWENNISAELSKEASNLLSEYNEYLKAEK